MEAAELEALTFTHMPLVVFERLLRAVFTAHAAAAEEVRGGFAEQEATNLLPYYRRAKLEGYLRDTAERSGIRAEAIKSPGSGWFHTEVRSGPVVLTASSVQTPCGLVDPSEFRLTLAEPNELFLWEEPGDAPPADAPLYALLLHSRSQWLTKSDRQKYGHLPGSAYLAYPAPGLGAYVHGINLFERFPAVVESFLPQEWDTEARVKYLFNARKIAVA